MITGLDLVEWQLRVANGEPLPLRQSQVTRRGHAVEARLYAEDPERGFLPSTGRIERLQFPTHLEHVRVDTGIREGDEVSIHYDPMVAKLIAWGADRLDAIDRLRAALESTDVDGVRTNTRFLWEILGHEAVRAGDVSTRLLEAGLPASGATGTDVREAWLIAGAIGAHLGTGPARGIGAPGMPWAERCGFRLNARASVRVALALGGERRWLRLQPIGPDVEIELEGRTHLLEGCQPDHDRIRGRIDGEPFEARYEAGHDGFVLRRECLRFEFVEDTGAEHHASAEHEGHLRSPMPGLVLDVRARPGERVEAGTVLVVLEAMKMEHSLGAPWSGTVASVAVKPGDRVEEGVELVVLEPLADDSLREAANTK
jgi:3-methylcrotonyl-CoA carboxylase alpha subunit